MSAEFSIHADPDRDLVRIVMKGLFEADDIERFIAERERAHAELRCAPNMHLTLNDSREIKIQPQASVAAFQKVLADPAYRSRKLAFVVAPTLARAQLLRAIADRGARMFDSVALAEAWLFAADEATSPIRAAG